jgi:hypothetical protein
MWDTPSKTSEKPTEPSAPVGAEGSVVCGTCAAEATLTTEHAEGRASWATRPCSSGGGLVDVLLAGGEVRVVEVEADEIAHVDFAAGRATAPGCER